MRSGYALGTAQIARIFDSGLLLQLLAELQACMRLVGSEVVSNPTKRTSSLSKGFCVAAHPSTAEEHARLGDAARAQSLNKDTSNEFLQEETEQKRSHRAKTAFNIVFVTSEVTLTSVEKAWQALLRYVQG